MCKNVHLTIPKLSISIHEFLPPPYRSADVILGVTWLETLGKVMFDYKLSEMEFLVGEWLIILQREFSEDISRLNL